MKEFFLHIKFHLEKENHSFLLLFHHGIKNAEELLVTKHHLGITLRLILHKLSD